MGSTLTKYIQTSHAFLKEHTRIINNKLTKQGVAASFLGEIRPIFGKTALLKVKHEDRYLNPWQP